VPDIQCQQCKRPYPTQGLPYRCPACGGGLAFDGPITLDLDRVEADLPGIWRYRHTFSLFPGAQVVSLGEGNTPLVWEELDGLRLGLKMEAMNPTGSYKDRGTAVLVSQLAARGARSAVEDSSGNAGASFAAYAARARLGARVFVPEAASGPKRAQIEAYGAELVRLPGPRSAAAQAVQTAAGQGAVYASHAYLAFGLPGIATIAYELYAQLGRAPGSIVAPVGHGGLLVGIQQGFTALVNSGKIPGEPYYLAVQAERCAPLWWAATHSGGGEPAEGQTIAEGVRVKTPAHLATLLELLDGRRGAVAAVAEDDILPAYRELAGRGIYVEPTSAIVWSAIQPLMGRIPEPIVLILTGSGLKYQ
jgi:threonine synthase